MNGRLTRTAQGVFCALFVCLLFLTPFSIPAIEILSVLLLVAWGLGAHQPAAGFSSAIFPVERATLWALLLYVAICGLSVIQSHFLATSLKGLIGKTAQYALLFVFASYAMKHRGVSAQAVRAVLIAAWLVVLYGLWQEWAIFRAPYKSTVPDPIRGFVLGYVRMVGPYKNPNDLATYLMVASLLVIALIAENGRRLPIHFWMIAALLVGCLIWTVARGAILGFFIGLLLLFAFYGGRKKSRWVLTTIAAAAAVFMLFLCRSNWRDLLTLSDIGSRDRTVMWSTGWAMFRDQPWLGHGINTFMANYQTYAGGSQWPAYAHNCYLQIAAETGIIGLASFLLFLFCLGSVCWRSLQRPAESLPPQSRELRPILIGLTAGVLAFLVQSAFDTNLYAVRQATLFWTLSGMMLGIGALLSSPHP